MKKSFLQTVAGKRVIFFGWILGVIILNYISVQVMRFLNLPFFLDTWGTSVGVMAAGLPAGIAGGVIYNLIMAFTVWGSAHWVWIFVNILVAIMTFLFWRKGWIDIKKPGKVFLTGLIIGLVETVLVIAILFAQFGGVDTYEGTIPTYDALLESTGSKVVAAISEKLITIPVDQIVAMFLTAIVFSVIPKKFVLTKRRN
jgi:hypothetical protein